ncbi:MAG: methyl-accepting chemotaxis protein [Pseudomonadota bacterium]
MLDQNNPSIGRFDKSFLIHMIKDFFVVLVIVTVLEFGIKASLVYYNFAVDGAEEAELVAEDLTNNVRSIMLNEGGPVAARTLYPILEKNWTDLGYVIAIEPSAVTVASIEENYGYRPEGIPAPDWPEGAYKVSEVSITAQEFCLACHSAANVGDVLGVVTVRNYLSRDFALWLKDVQLTAGLAVWKIVLHSILLFLILRARMEPLLRLRAVVGNLAKAYGGLDHRAEVRSSDEFGVLARDLNLFLDRINRLVAELDMVLSKVVRVNDDIVSIQGDLRDQIDTVVSSARQLEREAMLTAKREPRLSQAWFDAVKGAVTELDAKLKDVSNTPAAAELVEQLRAVVTNAEAQIENGEKVYQGLADLGDRSEVLKGSMAEMTRLEERMKSIVETGSLLVKRLRPEADG